MNGKAARVEVVTAVEQARASGMSARAIAATYDLPEHVVGALFDVQDAQAGFPPMCGTHLGYRAHVDQGQRPCTDCARAQADALKAARWFISEGVGTESAALILGLSRPLLLRLQAGTEPAGHISGTPVSRPTYRNYGCRCVGCTHADNKHRERRKAAKR